MHLTGLCRSFRFRLILLACLAAGPANAACTNPSGNEGDQFYNGDYHTWQFCNGTGWLAYGGGSACTPVGNYSPTAPSGTGYFVLTSTTYTGNFGGVQAADALCLTELTTNTGWMGYATANSNGQLVADKVHAFLGDTVVCNNLMPLTTYYFANAANGAAGGASFTTNSNGLGPNDAADWSAANYFSGTYTYWVSENTQSSTVWSGTPGNCSSCGNHCSNWTSTSGNASNMAGQSAQTTQLRWNGTSPTCASSQHLICFVNP